MTLGRDAPARVAESSDSGCPPPQIRRQLQRMLDSTTFGRAPGRKRFLQFLVEETLAGRGDALKQQSIARQVMGQGDDFDPMTDTRVRSEAKRLRRSIARYYETEGQQDLIRIRLLAGTYAPVFTRNGARAW